jgi:hypothetical protein
MSWPGLQVGDWITARLFGHAAARGFVVVIEPDGSLGLACPPATPRGRWRPRWLTRQQVQALWGGGQTHYVSLEPIQDLADVFSDDPILGRGGLADRMPHSAGCRCNACVYGRAAVARAEDY